MQQQWRGPLYPARLPSFHRVPPPALLADRIRWFWIPEWDLAPGRTSRQEVLPFPALNLVVEPAGTRLYGPATRRSVRDLQGTGWAFGLLLRPAAVPLLCADPGALKDASTALERPGLRMPVTAAMESKANDDDGGARRAAAVAAASAWVEAALPKPPPESLLANRFEDLIEADPSLTRVDQAADLLGVSVRSLQRIARKHVGLPPLAMIRRYRLQEAADRLRTDPDLGIADVAAELGYADHAHLTDVFREVLGFTPSEYRRSAERGDGK
ncbi:helix-turn-helix transcriptional regulator [Arthrobacter sp. BL-252-APC-1A]|uniref:AraC family transcriptional regulator n=1 Tax=Arthrobacter sp. BL-252-APC-1A TaxID=2606622 RepID=UPI0012B32EF3|nr:helix-turn-helix domain-containing protein [Arthrobacter sp. BL-252-APC-1A]MSR98524.1 helix-turn-helix transcriptional regulator [Arthrobacter sp. BL-252-APC-1A]